ncbi:MAG: prepilin-type N-terminal cleavage/methylation domain-containing protein [Desulfobacter sp.]|nr:MAG: prepilin-type N-terminal cleavage/methylation domain-containing protein [Desulfobacter sp.]
MIIPVELKNQKGFSLIEVIITLIVVSILGAMLVSYTGTALEKSAQPVADAIDSQSVSSCMDSIVQYYRNELFEAEGPTYDVNELDSRIASGGFAATCSANLNITRSWVRYDPGSGDLASGTSTDMLRVDVNGTSGVSYTMIFSSKE